MGGLRGVRAGPGSGPPPFSGGSFCRRPDSSMGGVGQKLDDRPGDIEFTDGVCTGAEAGSGITHSYGNVTWELHRSRGWFGQSQGVYILFTDGVCTGAKAGSGIPYS